MKIILLSKINKLGNFGDIIKTKSGYARNYLIPNKKAIIASKKNIDYYEKEKKEILENNKTKSQNVEANALLLQNINLLIYAKTSKKNKLYGSIGLSNIIKSLNNLGIKITQKEIKLKTNNIKNLGNHKITLLLNNIKEVTINIEIMKE